jgi:hypothetical protein
MRNWTPSIVPTDNQTVYLVQDDFGTLGQCWRETDITSADLESIIVGMLTDQYSDPVRVIGFNTAEGWSRDVSEDVADEIRRRCNLRAADIPAQLEAFMVRHEPRIDRVQMKLV